MKEMSGKTRKVFLEDLPRKGINNIIDWFNCKNHKVKFIYYDKEGWVDIVEVKRENNLTILGIRYLGGDIFYIWTGNFQNCRLGEVLGINTVKHYYNVGDIVKVSTGEIKIKKQTRDKNNKKDYIFECLECGWDNGRISEGNLKKKQGCGCCANKVPVTGINTIETTHPWMLKYFKNPKEAERRTFGSQDSGLLYCPVCKTPKDKMAISTLYREKDICCDVCWDGFSYGEKFTYSLLKQLGIKVKRHKYFEWSRNIYSEIESLCGSKEYDFYIKTDNMDILIETNGLQHYKDFSFSRRSYFEESENDKLKEKIALQNGIKEENYIVIDCRYSNLEFIKNSMLKNNKLTNRFDLNNIDWGKCEEDALCSYLVKACDYYNQGIGHMEIAKIMDIDFKTVKRYLKRARDYNLCDFKTRNELKIENKIKSIEMWNSRIHNSSEIARVLNLDNTVISDYLIEAEKEGIIEYKKYINSPKRKPIRNIEYNKEFDSINQASNMSKDVFGIQLYREGITNACNTGQAYKGLHFQYNDNTYSIQ